MPDLSGLREGDEIAISDGFGTFYAVRKVANVHKKYVVDGLDCKWSMDGCARPYDVWGESAAPVADWHRGQMVVRECLTFLESLLKDKRLRNPDVARNVMVALMPVLSDDDVDADHG